MTSEEIVRRDRVALDLAEAWIAERGGYVEFASQYLVVGDVVEVIGIEVDDNRRLVRVAVDKEKTFKHAVDLLRTRFEQGYETAERQGSRYLTSADWQLQIVDNEEIRRFDKLRERPAVGYSVQYLTEADVSAFEAGFKEGSTFHVLSPRENGGGGEGSLLGAALVAALFSAPYWLPAVRARIGR